MPTLSIGTSRKIKEAPFDRSFFFIFNEGNYFFPDFFFPLFGFPDDFLPDLGFDFPGIDFLLLDFKSRYGSVSSVSRSRAIPLITDILTTQRVKGV